jgi:hypothetical protein
MLELLKEFHARPIELPARRAWRPDRERLALRFEASHVISDIHIGCKQGRFSARPVSGTG